MRIVLILFLSLILVACWDKPKTNEPSNSPILKAEGPANSQFTKLRYVPSHSKVYVCDVGNNKIQIFDLSSKTFSSSIDVNNLNIVDFDVDNSGEWIFIGLQNSVQIIALNNTATTYTVTAPSGKTLTSLSVDNDKILYVGYISADQKSGEVLKYNQDSWQNQRAATPLGNYAYIVGHNKTLNRLYTATSSRVGRRVMEWDLSQSPAVTKDLGSIFGQAYSDPGNVVASADKIYAYSKGDPRYTEQNRQWFGNKLYDGVIPVINRQSSEEERLQLPYQVTALAMDEQGDRLVVAHSKSVINPSTRDRHPVSKLDLHVFHSGNEVEPISINEFTQIHDMQLHGSEIYLVAEQQGKHHLQIVSQ